MTTVMGFDVSNVPTADLMELAATLLEVDARSIANMRALMGDRSDKLDQNIPVAALLRERAAVVRALESMPRTGELDS